MSALTFSMTKRLPVPASFIKESVLESHARLLIGAFKHCLNITQTTRSRLNFLGFLDLRINFCGGYFQQAAYPLLSSVVHFP